MVISLGSREDEIRTFPMTVCTLATLLNWGVSQICLSLCILHCVSLSEQYHVKEVKSLRSFSSVWFSSVTQSCPTLCVPMDCSMPGFSAHHQLTSIESVMPSNHLILCCPLLLLPSIFPTSGSFQMSQFFASGSQSIRVSASASVPPINIQGWFPLGSTGLISLLFNGLSKVFTTVRRHQFFSA